MFSVLSESLTGGSDDSRCGSTDLQTCATRHQPRLASSPPLATAAAAGDPSWTHTAGHNVATLNTHVFYLITVIGRLPGKACDAGAGDYRPGRGLRRRRR